jgi:RNA recognition motif-containing protein
MMPVFSQYHKFEA